MFEFMGGLISGGWDAVENIVGGIGKGASGFVSGFFPTPQRERIDLTLTKPAGGTGQTYRVTDPESPSMFETAAQAAQGWLGTPYEQQLASGTDIATGMERQVYGMEAPPSGFDKMLQDVYGFGEGIAEKAGKITTLADQFFGLGERLGIVKPRQVIIETPRAGYPEGQDVRHISDIQKAGADVLTQIKGFGTNLLEQVKGLFSLAYKGPTGSQPVFSIKHDVEPTPKTTWLIVGVLAVIVILFLVGRKK